MAPYERSGKVMGGLWTIRDSIGATCGAICVFWKVCKWLVNRLKPSNSSQVLEHAKPPSSPKHPNLHPKPQTSPNPPK